MFGSVLEHFENLQGLLLFEDFSHGGEALVFETITTRLEFTESHTRAFEDCLSNHGRAFRAESAICHVEHAKARHSGQEGFQRLDTGGTKGIVTQVQLDDLLIIDRVEEVLQRLRQARLETRREHVRKASRSEVAAPYELLADELACSRVIRVATQHE